MQVLNDLAGYVAGEWKYVTPEGDLTDNEYHYINSGGVKGWDIRLGTILHNTENSYVECVSERYADRNNDEYDADIDVRYSTGKGDAVNFGNAYRSTDESKTYTPHAGYDLLGNGVVRCWYCNTVFDFAISTRWTMEQFVTEMLVHYSEHRAANDLPWVRTYIKVGVRRPDGSVVVIPENARRVTKPWQVKGALI